MSNSGLLQIQQELVPVPLPDKQHQSFSFRGTIQSPERGDLSLFYFNDIAKAFKTQCLQISYTA